MSGQLLTIPAEFRDQRNFRAIFLPIVGMEHNISNLVINRLLIVNCSLLISFNHQYRTGRLIDYLRANRALNDAFDSG